MPYGNVANGVCKTHFLEQAYVRNEGHSVISKLPPSAKASLRYYETAATTQPFTALPPLPACKLGGQAYFHLAVTDWSLFVLARTSSSDPDAVLLELPWLMVKDIDIQTLDSGQVLQEINGKQLRANVISLYPRVDVSQLPKHLATRLHQVDAALTQGHTPAEALKQSEPVPWYKKLFSKTPQTPPDTKLPSGDGTDSQPNPQQNAQPTPPEPTAQNPGHQGPWTLTAPAAPPPAAPSQQHQRHVQYPEPPSHHQQQHNQNQYLMHPQYQPHTQHALSAATPAPCPYVTQPHTTTSPPLGVSPARIARHLHSTPAPGPTPLPPATAGHPGVYEPVPLASLHPAHRPAQRGQPLAESMEHTGPDAARYHPPPHPAPSQQQYLPFSGQHPPAAAPQHFAKTPLQITTTTSQPQNPWYGYYGPTTPTTPAPPHTPPRHTDPLHWSPPDSPQPGAPTPSAAWQQQGRPSRPTIWAPPTQLPPPAPLDLRAPVLAPVSQPCGDERWPDSDTTHTATAEDLVLSDYALVFITLEKRTHLAYHIRSAWLGAHMRTALATAAHPGTPIWYTPPDPVTLSNHHTNRHKVLQYLLGKQSRSVTPQPFSAASLLSALFPGSRPATTGTTHLSELSSQRHNDEAEVQHLVEQLTNHLSQPITNRQVHEAWEHAEAVLLRGCSLWDDTDVAVMQDLMLQAGVCTGPTAHAHSAAFFRSRAVMVFIVSRLYAWGAVCALWGPRAGRAPTRKAVTPYVQWVLSRNQDLRDSHGRGVREITQGPMSPWSAARQTPSAHTPPPKPWDSPTYDITATPRQAMMPPGTPTQSKPYSDRLMQTHTDEGAPAQQTSHRQPAAARALWQQSDSNLDQHTTTSYTTDPPRSEQLPPGRHQARPAPLLVPTAPHSRTPPHTPAPAPPYRQYAPLHKPTDDPDRLTGRKATADEEAYAYFLDLYRSHTWQGLDSGGGCGGGGGPLGLRRVLPRLGLSQPSGAGLSISAALDTIHSIIRQQSRYTGPAGRSKPPPVQAPPTLSPYDPLSLSPLPELPYLFVLEVPEAATSTRSALSGRGQQHAAAVLGASGQQVVEQARHRAQTQLQTQSVGKALQSQFMEDALGGGEPETRNVQHTAAMERWERLVGRLAAATAWRKIQVLLAWLQTMMDHSEGCAERHLWCSEEVVEQGPSWEDGCNDDGGSTWTRSRCTRHMAKLLPQLRDPTGPPTLQVVLPQSPTDLTWWCRAEAGSVWLDSCASLLGQLSSLSLQAAAHRKPQDEERRPQPLRSEDVVIEAVGDLPLPLVHAFCRRLMSRLCSLMVGAAAVHHSSLNHDKDLAHAHALRVAELLLLLLNRVPRASAVIYDALDHRLFHTLRTPQVTGSLGQCGSDLVLGQLCRGLLAEVLGEVEGAGPEHRPASWYRAGLSQHQVTNMGSLVGRHVMPGVLI